jgi:hypothetical protein
MGLVISELTDIESLLQIVQTGSEVHPTSYPMDTGDSFPGGKRSEREVDHSSPTSAEVKKMWIYTSTPNTPSWRSAKLVQHRDNFTFLQI